MAQWIDSDGCERVGYIGFLVESLDTSRGGNPRFYLLDTPLRTNRSREPRLEGWCGETNNVSRTAQGLARVTRVTAAGDRVQVVKLDGQELAGALEARGYPELVPA